MADRLERAREDVRRASDLTDDETVRAQLRSIDDGLKEMTQSSTEEGNEAATTEGDVPHGDALEEVESKLAGLGDEAGERTRSLIQDARDHIDDYRRTYTRDW